MPSQWRIESWTEPGAVADALREFAGWHPQVIAMIGAAETTNRWALYDRDPLLRWTIGRVTLLGDAAHAMLPYMAQGAVQAIEDAAVLAKCLARVARHDLVPALRRYEETRKPRAMRCQEGSRRNGDMYHLADGEQQQLRDRSLGSVTTVPLPQNAWLYGHDVESEFLEAQI
jgi:salicylate hydroxylase